MFLAGDREQTMIFTMLSAPAGAQTMIFTMISDQNRPRGSIMEPPAFINFNLIFILTDNFGRSRPDGHGFPPPRAPLSSSEDFWPLILERCVNSLLRGWN